MKEHTVNQFLFVVTIDNWHVPPKNSFLAITCTGLSYLHSYTCAPPLRRYERNCTPTFGRRVCVGSDRMQWCYPYFPMLKNKPCEPGDDNISTYQNTQTRLHTHRFQPIRPTHLTHFQYRLNRHERVRDPHFLQSLTRCTQQRFDNLVDDAPSPFQREFGQSDYWYVL